MADLTIISWNIKQLGITKSKNAYFQRVFKHIANRADIVLVMEVQPATAATVTSNILKALNTPVANTWRVSVSPRNTIRTSKKGDAYAAFYKTAKVAGVRIAQFPPECHYNPANGGSFPGSIFDNERNPYNFYFDIVQNNETLDTYIYHAPEPSKQADVVKYVGKLSDIQDVSANRNLVIAGDFNTDKVHRAEAFKELIDDLDFTMEIDIETTTTSCLPTFKQLEYANPYDNILVKNVTPSDPGRLNVITTIFNDTANLRTSYPDGVIANIGDALWVYKHSVSDHMPIECDLDF